MMHQKKIAKLKKFLSKNLLHSIPITINKIKDKSLCRSYKLDFNSNKYNNLPKSNKFDKYKVNATVSCAKKTNKKLLLHHNFSKLSYSIPLLSMFALLLIGGVSVIGLDNTNNISNKAYAQNNDIDNNINDSNVGDDEDSDVNSNENYDVSLLSDATSYLSISQPNLTSERIAPGEVGYVSSNVTYSASDIESYALQLTYASGYDSLKLDKGITTLAGADGKTANAMSDNTWGFAWSNTGDNQEGLTYYTVPAYGTKGTNINAGLLENNATSNVSNTKKLTFAAKFGENGITSGHYKTSVLLSLAANPKLVTYSVTYNANAGTDVVANLPQNFSIDSAENTQAYTIPDTTPTRTGYEFLGYSTNPAATTADADYAPGKTITLAQSSSSLALYAIWEYRPYVYTITYTASYSNTDVSAPTGIPESQTCTSSTPSCTTTISSQKPYVVCANFKNWKLGSNSYNSGDSITINSNVTLTAVWSGPYKC